MNIFGFIIHQKVNLMKLDHQRLFDLFTEEYIKEFGTDKDVKDVSCNGLLERATAKETNKGKQRVFSLVNYGYLGDYVVWVEHFTDGQGTFSRRPCPLLTFSKVRKSVSIFRNPAFGYSGAKIAGYFYISSTGFL